VCCQCAAVALAPAHRSTLLPQYLSLIQHLSFHRHILLNGRELRLNPDGSLPPFQPKYWNMTKPLIMPPLSMVFWVIQEVHAPACEGQWVRGITFSCANRLYYTHHQPQLQRIPRPPSVNHCVIFIKHYILQHHPLAENTQLWFGMCSLIKQHVLSLTYILTHWDGAFKLLKPPFPGSEQCNSTFILCFFKNLYNKFANYFYELKFSGNTHQRP
jgi:hypothetical protein